MWAKILLSVPFGGVFEGWVSPLRQSGIQLDYETVSALCFLSFCPILVCLPADSEIGYVVAYLHEFTDAFAAYLHLSRSKIRYRSQLVEEDFLIYFYWQTFSVKPVFELFVYFQSKVTVRTNCLFPFIQNSE